MVPTIIYQPRRKSNNLSANPIRPNFHAFLSIWRSFHSIRNIEPYRTGSFPASQLILASNVERAPSSNAANMFMLEL